MPAECRRNACRTATEQPWNVKSKDKGIIEWLVVRRNGHGTAMEVCYMQESKRISTVRKLELSKGRWSGGTATEQLESKQTSNIKEWSSRKVDGLRVETNIENERN